MAFQLLSGWLEFVSVSILPGIKVEPVDGKAVTAAGSSSPQGNSPVTHARWDGVCSKSGRKNLISSAAYVALVSPVHSSATHQHTHTHTCICVQHTSMDNSHLSFQIWLQNGPHPLNQFIIGLAFFNRTCIQNALLFSWESINLYLPTYSIDTPLFN